MHITKNFFMMIATILFFALPVNAKQYCQEAISAGANTIYLSCERFGIDQYQITIESEVDINGLGGSFMHINENQATDIRTYLTISADKKTATIAFTSSTAPDFYTPLYILMPGEVTFSWPTDIEWGLCNNDATAYTITVVQPSADGAIAADKTSAKYGEVVTLTATPNEGKQLDKWFVTDGQNNSITVTKNQFSMPADNVTITATFKDKVNLTPAVYQGVEKAEIAGATCTFTWSITRNADQTLTFATRWDKEIVGIVPQVAIQDVFHTMIMQGRSAQFTTTDTYEDGTTLVLFFYMAYAGGATRIDLNYVVGSEKGISTQGIDKVQGDDVQSTKVIENGVLYIEQNGRRYSILGNQL